VKAKLAGVLDTGLSIKMMMMMIIIMIMITDRDYG
jgi:hypothetical protein